MRSKEEQKFDCFDHLFNLGLLLTKKRIAMRKFTLLLLAIVFAFSSNAGIIYVPSDLTDNAKAGKASVVDMLSQMDAKTFASLTPGKIAEMTGQKMTLGQKINLKLIQKEVRKELKKGHNVNMMEMAKRVDGTTFNWGAAALGFFLGLIGVLIVYLAFRRDPQIARRSAWIGFAVWAAIVIISYVL